MISRVWHGWTTQENAERYQELVTKAVLPDMESLGGYRGTWLLRRELDSGEVEFLVVTRWDSLDDIRAFAANVDYLRTTITPEAEQLLAHCDSHAVQYEQILEPGQRS